MESRFSLAKNFATFFWGVICWKIPGNVAMGKILRKKKKSGFFLGPAVQQVNLFIFRQGLVNTGHQTRLTFDLETETTHGHFLFVPDKGTWV